MRSKFIVGGNARPMQTQESVLKTNKVLRNTYFLLAITIAFSACTAFLAMAFNAPYPSLITLLVGFYGLLFVTHKLANSPFGIVAVLALTGFMGYTLGPIVSMYLSHGAGDIVVLALAGTALVFFSCSAYLIFTKKDMSFISGMLFSLFIVLVVAVIASLFFNIPALSLAISALFIVFSTGAILLETSNIIHGGQTNYILATINIYVSLYNIFLSLLRIIGASRD